MENEEKLESLSKDKWWNRTEDTNWVMEGDMKIFDKRVLENMGTEIFEEMAIQEFSRTGERQGMHVKFQDNHIKCINSRIM